MKYFASAGKLIVVRRYPYWDMARAIGIFIMGIIALCKVYGVL